MTTEEALIEFCEKATRHAREEGTGDRVRTIVFALEGLLERLKKTNDDG